MSEARTFVVCFTWEIEDGIEMPVRVIGKITPFLPESKKGHPDTWTPAEGAELEDLKVFNDERFSKEIEDRLLNDEKFLARVRKELMLS